VLSIAWQLVVVWIRGRDAEVPRKPHDLIAG
jgi:hypothetical protein